MDLLRVANELKSVVQGDVSFDAGARALYAMDGSNYRQVPLGGVAPKTIEDVVAAIGVCKKFGVPVFSRGGGTRFAGEGCNTAGCVYRGPHLKRIEESIPN